MSITKHVSEPRALKRRKLSHSSEELEVQDNPDFSESDDSFTESREQASSEKKRGSKYETAPTTAHGTGNALVASSSQDVSILATGSGKWRAMILLTDEFLSQLRPNYEAQLSRSTPLVTRITKYIQNLPPRQQLSIREAEASIHKQSGLLVPFCRPRPGKDTKYTFEYRKPTSIKLIGDVSLNLHLKSQRTLELAVKMPSEMFQPKDYLNYRASHKRSYYLACIAAGLKNELKDEFDMSFEYQHEVEMLVSLLLKPSGTESTAKVQLRIVVVLPDDIFPVDKLSPDKNCVRPPSRSPDDKLESTQFYNSCLQSTISAHASNTMIEKAIATCPGFADACRLARVWLQQRDFGPSMSMGGFGPVEWALVCASLLSGGGQKGRPLFSTRYSSVNLFKAMLQFLAAKDLTSPMQVASQQLPLLASEYPMFYHGGLGLNILFKMTPWSYQMLRHEAKRSAATLESLTDEVAFDKLFIHHAAASLLRFDETFFLDLTPAPEQQNECEGAYEDERLLRMYRVLCKGLGDRTTLVNLETSPQDIFGISKGKPKRPAKSHVTINLLLDEANANRAVDRGPFEGDTDQEDFQKFWGSRAELRRFKDNAVARESLVWSDNPSIRLQVVQHLLQHHFGIGPGNVKAKGTNLVSLILQKEESPEPSDSFKLISKTFQTLTSTLHNLKTLPLRIHTIQPASPELSSSSLNLPLDSSNTSEPINITIEFEASPNWPDSLPAIQYTKIAFLIKIADRLDTEHSSLNLITRVGIENEQTSTQGYLNTSFLDIIFPSPQPGKLRQIPFRIRICHEREEHLIRTLQAEKTLHGSLRDTLESALQLHKREKLVPKHTLAIGDLCRKFTNLSPTIRLLKKWIASHLLTSVIPDQIIDTIGASVFTSTHPLSPGPLTLTFLSALKTLASWTWQSEPMIVDLKILDPDSPDDLDDSTSTKSLTEASYASFRLKSTAWRDIDPRHHRVAACIFTNIDHSGVAFTQIPKDTSLSSFAYQGLSALALSRAQQLARASVEVIESKARSGSLRAEDWQEIFITPTSHYDFLLYLNAKTSAKDKKGKETQFKNLAISSTLDAKIEEIGLDPISTYLSHLQRTFGRACTFFYGPGSGVIGGLWDQNAQKMGQFRVRSGVSVMPVGRNGEEGEGEVVLNKTGILSEVTRMGEGVVRRVEILKKDESSR